MKKIKELFKNIKIKELLKNKKVLIIAGAVLVLIVIVLFVVLLSSDKKVSKEEEMKSELKALGTAFYENLYFDQVGKTEDEKAKFLEKYKDLGIKINLSNLTRFNAEENKEVLDELTKYCNLEETKVVIYPKDPYEKKSYNVELITDCDFDKK